MDGTDAREFTGFSKEDTTDEQRFTLLQSMLMYQLLGLFHHDEQRESLCLCESHAELIASLLQNDCSRIPSMAPWCRCFDNSICLSVSETPSLSLLTDS